MANYKPKQCKHCGKDFLTTNPNQKYCTPQCSKDGRRACKRAYRRWYAQKTKEHIRESNRKYYLKNKEHIKQRSHEYYSKTGSDSISRQPNGAEATPKFSARQTE